MIPLDLDERSNGKTRRSLPKKPSIFGEAEPLD